MKKITNLEAKFDTRKSFYGKAKIERIENTIRLISYSTFVACAVPGNNGKYEIYDENGNRIDHIKDCSTGYSQTTTRHIKEFFKQFNGECENYAQYSYGI